MLPADVQQVLVVKEEVPLEWSSSLEEQEPEVLHIKEEEEEFSISQEGEQNHGHKKTDIITFLYNEYNEIHEIKAEDNRDPEPSNSSSSRHVKIETNEEDSKGPELTGNSYLNSCLQLNMVEKASQSSETDASDDDWQEPLSASGPGKDFASGLKETTSLVHTREKQFHCGVCGKTFKHRYELKRHMIVHTGEKPYVCCVCSKRFSNQGNVKRHMSFHTGEKPFGCDVCGYRFDEKVHLEKHMRVHSGENPIQCDSCGKHFKYPSDLKIHMRVHTGEAPFQCDICGKMFKYRCDLTKHSKVHSGKAQFPCNVCNKRFTYQSSLKKHMGIHTQEEIFGCGKNSIAIREVN